MQRPLGFYISDWALLGGWGSWHGILFRALSGGEWTLDLFSLGAGYSFSPLRLFWLSHWTWRHSHLSVANIPEIPPRHTWWIEFLEIISKQKSLKVWNVPISEKNSLLDIVLMSSSALSNSGNLIQTFFVVTVNSLSEKSWNILCDVVSMTNSPTVVDPSDAQYIGYTCWRNTRIEAIVRNNKDFSLNALKFFSWRFLYNN